LYMLFYFIIIFTYSNIYFIWTIISLIILVFELYIISMKIKLWCIKFVYITGYGHIMYYYIHR